MKELIEKVQAWGDDKGITGPENLDKQFMKFVEEALEVKTEIDVWTRIFADSERERLKVPQMHNIKMEMGDILVTLVIMAKQLDIDLGECLKLAYDKIKDRKGETIDGVFIKEEDL